MRRRSGTGRGKRTLAWGLACFALVQIGLNIFIDARRPDLYDPEYHARLTLLEYRRAESSRPPLLLVVGSSRTVMAFRPEVLPPLQTRSGQRALAFNFSHLGAGPVANLMELRRLLDRGIRPDWLVLEVMPPFLAIERMAQTTETAAARDLALLRRYYSSLKTYGIYAKSRLVPCHSHRFALVRTFAPNLLPAEARAADAFPLDTLGSWWVRDCPSHQDAELAQSGTGRMRAEFFERLQNFSILDGPARALRDTLDLCRRERITAVLVLTPESVEFRSWYSNDALEKVQRLCADLTRQYDVPVIDARAWLADADFSDGHHVLRRGADAFTLRLGREVLQPLVEGGLAPNGRFVALP